MIKAVSESERKLTTGYGTRNRSPRDSVDHHGLAVGELEPLKLASIRVAQDCNTTVPQYHSMVQRNISNNCESQWNILVNRGGFLFVSDEANR